MTLKSALPGRERWHVAALVARAEAAAEVASRLTASGEVRQATANSVTGSLLVEFDPDVAPMRIRTLIASTVAQVLEHAPRRPRRDAVVTQSIEPLQTLLRPYRPAVIAASLFTMLKAIFDLVPVVLIAWGLSIAGGGPAPVLASVGIMSRIWRLVTLFAFGIATNALSYITGYAARLLWRHIGSAVRRELPGKPQTAPLQKFIKHDLYELLVFGTQAAVIAGMVLVYVPAMTLFIAVPVTMLVFLSAHEAQKDVERPMDVFDRVPIVHQVRHWLRMRNLVAYAPVAISGLLALIWGGISPVRFQLTVMLTHRLVLGSATLPENLSHGRKALNAASEIVAERRPRLLTS